MLGGFCCGLQIVDDAALISDYAIVGQVIFQAIRHGINSPSPDEVENMIEAINHQDSAGLSAVLSQGTNLYGALPKGSAQIMLAVNQAKGWYEGIFHRVYALSDFHSMENRQVH